MDIINKNLIFGTVALVDTTKENKTRIFFKKVLASLVMATIFWMPLFSSAIYNEYFSLFVPLIFLALFFGFFLKFYKSDLQLKLKLYKNYTLWGILFLIVILAFSLIHSNFDLLSTLSYVLSIFIFIFINKKLRIYFGFFVGAIGFYWITIGFQYFGLSYLMVPGIIGISIVYAIIFYFLLYFNSVSYRLITIFILGFINPFDFNWMNINYFSAYTIFSTYSIIFIAFSIMFFRNEFYKTSLFLLLCSFDYNFAHIKGELNPYIVQTNYSQDFKWQKENKLHIIQNNIKEIEKAIDLNYKLVILPETAFPFVLEEDEILTTILKNLSKKIDIIVGALRIERGDKNKLFNSAYFFKKGDFIFYDKINLVAFGERIPLKNILGSLMNALGINFNLDSGNSFKAFDTNKISLNIAICFEATSCTVYENFTEKNDINYTSVISNNAWFYPSLESYIQNMIIKYYARKYRTFVFHATNFSKSQIITPNNGIN